MPKIKQCPHCESILVCSVCGKRVTPPMKRKEKKDERLTVMLTETENQTITDEAEFLGVTKSEIVRRKLKVHHAKKS